MNNSVPSFLFAFALLAGPPIASPQAQTQEENPAGHHTLDTDLPKAPGNGVDIEAVESKIFEDSNQFREENDEEPVERNGKLDAAARDFAEYMSETHRYGHTADGRRPSKRVSAANYDYCFVAENIAYEYRSEPTSESALATRLLDGWINSPGHRKNLLSTPSAETGLGIARSEKTGAYFAVQLFARPKSKAVRFRVENDSGETVRYALETGRGGAREYEVPPRASGIHEECMPPQMKLIDSEKPKSVETADGSKIRFVSDNDQIAIEFEKE